MQNRLVKTSYKLIESKLNEVILLTREVMQETQLVGWVDVRKPNTPAQTSRKLNNTKSSLQNINAPYKSAIALFQL
jgi:hypothetical protein